MLQSKNEANTYSQDYADQSVDEKPAESALNSNDHTNNSMNV